MKKIITHIKKLAVGVDSFEHLGELQNERFLKMGKCCAYTTFMPKRAEEIIDCGSIYWIIKGYISCRQKIIDFEQFIDANQKKRTLIILEKNLVRVEQFKHNPFQGWRYLKQEDCPKDLKDSKYKDSPQELIKELRDIGAL